MTPIEKIKIMLTGAKRKFPKKPAPDAAEEAAEGAASNPAEERLEDSKGKPMSMRFKKGGK